MSDISLPIAGSKNKIRSSIKSRIALGLSVAFQTLAIVIFGLVVIYGLGWFRTPFIGALVENTLSVSAVGPSQAGSWNGTNAGLTYRDQILALNNVKIGQVRDFLVILRSHEISDAVVLTVRSPNGNISEIEIVLQKVPTRDRITLLVLPYIIGIIYLGSGLWVLSLRRNDVSGKVFSIFTASIGISVASLLDIQSTNHLTYLWTFSTAIAGGSLFHLALVFPEGTPWLIRNRVLPWIGYLLSVILSLMAFPALFDVEKPFGYITPWCLEFIYLGIAGLIFLSLTIHRRFHSSSPIVRQQSTVILWGGVIAFLPICIWMFINVIKPNGLPFPVLLYTPLVVFPVSIAYAILRYRLIDTDYVFSRAVLYAFLSILAMGGYALLVSGATLFFGGVVAVNNPYFIGLMFFILALILNPMRTSIQKFVDSVFFRDQQVYQERIRDFGHELNPAMGLSEIAALLRGYVEENLMSAQLHIFVLDTLRDSYVAVPNKFGHPTTDIQFSLNSPLPQLLSREDSFIYLQRDQGLTPILQPEKARIALLGAELFVPMAGRIDQVIGFIALAPRHSGESYKNLDLNYLSSLCDQAAMAFERAQVVSDLERRVNEMNVLMRVSQGINITLGFDDILELIYAQTTRIIPSRDFWILLYDRENELYYYAFYLENDQRLVARENQALGNQADLAQEVIRAGQPILTDDFETETQARGIDPQVEGLFAWVGVPLNAGAETIGAMSLGSRDPSVIYSMDQVELLQAIADQAAGAIVKARLLEESERSAMQLNLLNEVARNLTSTLELSNLLDQILDNAIDIIGCEAGTLFLVDEETGELIFEVVKGPVAEELRSKRLPPGTGHAGRAVEIGKAAIVNEARQTLEWSRKPDQDTGFHTRDLLLAPMFAQDRVVGVIEVINRLDKLPFTKDDQELLTAFTSQAAIALENARLYTLTDQQLAERVDELSVMQRIDRELNASLDVSRAMRITLDWAMRQSGADAGLVGAVCEDGLRVMAHHGYSDELESFRDSIIPVELPGIKGAVDDESTQQIHRSEFLEQQDKSFTLLKDAQSQIVIPIRREDQVIGLLIIESIRDDPWTEDVQDFLSRLSDHAAIAIANAQLFLQVQEADLAKSEFVSFVSHELKTPMTSIRGYTDLLLGGAVGTINEAQENFLNTVRSNVNRMATLVSDLGDISRIESGRLRLEFASVEITSAVNEVVRSQTQGFEDKGQILKQEISDDLPPVWGDRIRIVQILTNLLSNANKYTPNDGSIIIRAERKVNLWDPEGAPEVVLIAVEDTGIGMANEDQAQIFTKFFRSADPKAREVAGTGLGLNITKYLVEMQGGKIWFESEYGKGTIFSFTMPIAEV
jgi:signal transduction histidine kinase